MFLFFCIDLAFVSSYGGICHHIPWEINQTCLGFEQKLALWMFEILFASAQRLFVLLLTHEGRDLEQPQ